MIQFVQATKYLKPVTCNGCSLEQSGQGFTIAKPAPIGAPLIVAESPDHHDIRIGTPLQVDGEMGSTIDRALRLAGLQPESFAFASLVACKPPHYLKGQVYEFTAPEHCSTRHLKEFIEVHRPRVIVALGPIVTRALTGMSGDNLTVDMIRGYAVPGIGVAAGIPVLPTVSSAYPSEMSLLKLDLIKALRIDGIPDDPEADQYYLHAFATRVQAKDQGAGGVPTLEFLLAHLLVDERRILVYDFEFTPAAGNFKKRNITTQSWITQVNFTVINRAYAPHEDETLLTMVADWSVENKDLAIAILQTPNVKVSYNGYHVDEFVALFNGFDIRGKEHHDCMWMVNFLFPDLPARRVTDEEDFLSGDDGALMKLQVAASLFDFPAPWKHLSGKDPHFYGARDTHATAVVFLGCRRMMQERKSYGTYDYFIRQYWDKLKRASLIGYPASAHALADLQELIKIQVMAAQSSLQDLVPPDLKPYKETRPRTEDQLARLKNDHPDDLFKTSVFEQTTCGCGKQVTGLPASACEDCNGTGLVEGKRTKCSQCSKHVLVGPSSSKGSKKKVEELMLEMEGEPLEGLTAKLQGLQEVIATTEAVKRWTCSCRWTDTRVASFETATPPVGVKATKAFFKTLHDDDLRSGRFICSTCKGGGLETNQKSCKCTMRHVYETSCPVCRGSGVKKGYVERWCIRQAFNSNSHQQIKRYVMARNHEIPKSGLGRDGIGQLYRQKGDPVYGCLHQIATLETIATAAAPLTAATAGSTGDVQRIHTKFSFVDAAGTITSKDPDIISAPPAHKYPEIAAQWSQILVTHPTPSTYLVHADFGPLELECFALEAFDEGLAALCGPDGQAEEWLTTVAKYRKSVQGTGAIAAIYKAFIRGLTPQSVFMRHRHLFTSADSIQYLLSKLEQNFPRAVEYRRMIALQAHKQGFLRSRFGFERQFYAVMRRSRSTGEMEQGADYSNAVSFMARNHAASTIALAALRSFGPHSELITPSEGPLGPNGWILEVERARMPNDPFAKETTFVLTRPNGTLWSPTIVYRPYGPQKDVEPIKVTDLLDEEIPF